MCGLFLGLTSKTSSTFSQSLGKSLRLESLQVAVVFEVHNENVTALEAVLFLCVKDVKCRVEHLARHALE